ncbi:MAG: hypothetical protein ACRDQA_09490, partial [Nocardioidaceae bacterium]
SQRPRLAGPPRPRTSPRSSSDAPLTNDHPKSLPARVGGSGLKKTVHSYGEAKRELTKLQNEVDEHRHPRSKVTVGEVIDRWLEVATLEDSTRDRYDGMIRLYIRPHLGSLEVGKVDAELLEHFYARLTRCKGLCSGPRP